MEYVTLEPEWENTALWFALGLSQHTFNVNEKAPVISFIEQIRYLSIKKPEAIERILSELGEK